MKTVRKVPARTRNGRIYTGNKIITSSGAGIEGGFTGEQLWVKEEAILRLSDITDSVAFGDQTEDYTVIDGSGNVNLHNRAAIHKDGDEVFTDPMTSGSCGPVGTFLMSSGESSAPVWANGVVSTFKQTADKEITNTTIETSLFGTGVGTRTIAANSLVAGNTIRINLQGVISVHANVNEPLTIRVKYGTSSIITIAGSLFQNLSEAVFSVDLMITARTVGASGTMRPAGFILIEVRAMGYPQMIRLQTASDFSVNTTTAKVIDITAEWGNAKKENILITNVSTIEIL